MWQLLHRQTLWFGNMVDHSLSIKKALFIFILENTIKLPKCGDNMWEYYGTDSRRRQYLTGEEVAFVVGPFR